VIYIVAMLHILYFKLNDIAM